MKKIRILQYSILGICAIVFTVCCVLLARTLVGYFEANKFYNDLTINKDAETTSSESEVLQETPTEIRSLMTSYRDLKKQYPNIIGYIHIPEVSISYPVVQGEDNEYYTNHLISGEENSSGSIFLDFRINSDPMYAENLIVYGHNMNSKTMFHNMIDLFDESHFRKAKVQYICDSGIYEYESLAVYMTDISDEYHAYGFSNKAVFADFFAARAAQSRFAVEYEQPSNLITLVTCSNLATDPDSRFIYHGRMTKIYTDFGENHE